MLRMKKTEEARNQCRSGKSSIRGAKGKEKVHN